MVVVGIFDLPLESRPRLVCDCASFRSGSVLSTPKNKTQRTHGAIEVCGSLVLRERKSYDVCGHSLSRQRQHSSDTVLWVALLGVGCEASVPLVFKAGSLAIAMCVATIKTSSRTKRIVGEVEGASSSSSSSSSSRSCQCQRINHGT